MSERLRMKILIKLLLISSALLTSANVAAFSSKVRSEECKKPQFKGFSLTEYKAPKKIEIPPESEFSFIVSNKVEPTSVKIIAKNKKLEYQIENRGSFYKINSKLPAEFTGKYVRLNVFATAKLDCKGVDGWLIKIADKPAEPKPEITPESKLESNKPESNLENPEDSTEKVKTKPKDDSSDKQPELLVY